MGPDPELVPMWYDWISGHPSPPLLCSVCVCVYADLLGGGPFSGGHRQPVHQVCCALQGWGEGVPSCWVVFWIPSPFPIPEALSDFKFSGS